MSRGTQLTFRGKTQSIDEWAAEIGMIRHTLRNRLKADPDVEKALTTPIQARKQRFSTPHREEPADMSYHICPEFRRWVSMALVPENNVT